MDIHLLKCNKQDIINISLYRLQKQIAKVVQKAKGKYPRTLLWQLSQTVFFFKWGFCSIFQVNIFLNWAQTYLFDTSTRLSLLTAKSCSLCACFISSEIPYKKWSIPRKKQQNHALHWWTGISATTRHMNECKLRQVRLLEGKNRDYH